MSTETLFTQIGSKFYWKTNLLLTEKYWKEWFEGLNKVFLESELPKALLLAGPNRMDTELTVAHM